jgi:hypothetical protein
MRLTANFPSRVRCEHPFDATPHEIVIVSNQDAKRFHFALPRAGVDVAMVLETAINRLLVLGRARPSIRFVMNNAIPFVLYEHAAGFAVAPPRL